MWEKGGEYYVESVVVEMLSVSDVLYAQDIQKKYYKKRFKDL